MLYHIFLFYVLRVFVLSEMVTYLSRKFILLVFFSRLPKFKYIKVILRLIRLEINLQDNTCKNAKSISHFFPIIFFFSLSLPKPTISEAIKPLNTEKKLILTQKGSSLIFKDGG